TELRNESLVCSYKKGQVLFYPGDSRNHLILLVSGIIKIEQNDRSGNFSYLHFMIKQALLPRIGLFQDEVHYDAAIA
ncbi:cyclic nucleotide-binding domain-containing protein, partial [Enterococcus faecalis]|uniref:cyclic nucleotide-binding domain-containing protein n=1 Tax=Enterococcus faecalis TaxID=1351 RepID=UPI003D6BD662